MITAKEAKSLAGPNLQDKIDSLGESIRKRAQEGHRSLRCGYDHSADSDLWIHGGYGDTDEWNRAQEALENLGYNVEFFYKNASFAVDMYTLIKW